MLKFETIAQDLVAATSPLISGRTVNIMNQQGIIIASSDTDRVGDFHQGAADVINKKKTVRIYRHQLPAYPGSKEGINMPITNNNEIIGVVGVYGDPDEVTDAANLLRVYVELYLKQVAHSVKQEVEEEIRNDILKLILSGERDETNSIGRLSSVIFLGFTLPLTCVLVKPKLKADQVTLSIKLRELVGYLVDNHLLLPREDIYGVVDEGLVILKNFDKASQLESWQKQVSYFLSSGFEQGYSLIFSKSCDNLEKLHSVYEGCLEIALTSPSGIYHLDTYAGMLQYFTQGYISEGTMGNDFIKDVYETLEKEMGEKAFKESLKTIEAYYDNDRSVGKAANQLFIHKNTLLYRINKVYDLLDLESESDYIKEFFLRLLLSYDNRGRDEN